jgi:hypothetical protein
MLARACQMREIYTRVNLLCILDIPQRVHVLKVCAFYWEASGNTTTGKDKSFIWDCFLAVLKSDRFSGGVHGRHALIPAGTDTGHRRWM